MRCAILLQPATNTIWNEPHKLQQNEAVYYDLFKFYTFFLYSFRLASNSSYFIFITWNNCFLILSPISIKYICFARIHTKHKVFERIQNYYLILMVLIALSVCVIWNSCEIRLLKKNVLFARSLIKFQPSARP